MRLDVDRMRMDARDFHIPIGGPARIVVHIEIVKTYFCSAYGVVSVVVERIWRAARNPGQKHLQLEHGLYCIRPTGHELTVGQNVRRIRLHSLKIRNLVKCESVRVVVWWNRGGDGKGWIDLFGPVCIVE